MMTFAFISFLAEAKTQFRKSCLTESIQLQKEIIIAEKTLFALNPLSTALQLQFDLKLAELPFSFGPAYIKVAAELAKIEADQMKLDRSQRSLISSTNFLINLKLAAITTQMLQNSIVQSKRWQSFLMTFFTIYPERMARMSVRAISYGIAPNYELQDDYKRLQMVAFTWQMKYQTRRDAQTLVDAQPSFVMHCQAVPEERDEKWSIEI